MNINNTVYLAAMSIDHTSWKEFVNNSVVATGFSKITEEEAYKTLTLGEGGLSEYAKELSSKHNYRMHKGHVRAFRYLLSMSEGDVVIAYSGTRPVGIIVIGSNARYEYNDKMKEYKHTNTGYHKFYNISGKPIQKTLSTIYSQRHGPRSIYKKEISDETSKAIMEYLK